VPISKEELEARVKRLEKLQKPATKTLSTSSTLGRPSSKTKDVVNYNIAGCLQTTFTFLLTFGSIFVW